MRAQNSFVSIENSTAGLSFINLKNLAERDYLLERERDVNLTSRARIIHYFNYIFKGRIRKILQLSVTVSL